MILVIITAIVVFILQEVRHEIIKPVQFEQKPDLMESWKDLILANIRSCFTTQHCFICRDLIGLFTVKFKDQLPPFLFEKELQSLWNKLDKRYKAIEAQDELSSTTVDQYID